MEIPLKGNAIALAAVDIIQRTVALIVLAVPWTLIQDFITQHLAMRYPPGFALIFRKNCTDRGNGALVRECTHSG